MSCTTFAGTMHQFLLLANTRLNTGAGVNLFMVAAENKKTFKPQVVTFPNVAPLPGSQGTAD